MEVKVVGGPCGYHGPYTFYKGVRITTSAAGSGYANQSNTSVKTENLSTDQCELDRKTGCEQTTVENNNVKNLVLGLGDCIPVRPWSDSPIACLAELRMVWKDKNEQGLLTSLRLYFLPENTPSGRNCHGEDEVIAISDRVVLRADDLLSWIDTNLDWNWGLKAAYVCDPNNKNSDVIQTHRKPIMLKHSQVDFADVDKEKELDGIFKSQVAVLSYARYCRYRATLRRLEGVQDKWMRTMLVEALCGFVAQSPNTRVMFCKEVIDYPDIETHELLCNHLAPKLKGRPRGRRKKMRSDSPSLRLRTDSPDSGSMTSEVSACSVEKIQEKLAKSHLRRNIRPCRTKLRSESEMVSDRKTSERKSKSTSEEEKGEIDEDDISEEEEDEMDDDESLHDVKLKIKRESNGKTTKSEYEKKLSEDFLLELMEFHKRREESMPDQIESIPKSSFYLKNVDLYAVYLRVQELGGYEVVSEKKLWRTLFGKGNGTSNTITRRKYEKLILPWDLEQQQNRTKLMETEGLIKSEVLDLNMIKKENDFEQTYNGMTDVQKKVRAAKEMHQSNQISDTKGMNLSMSNPNGVPVTVIVGSPAHESQQSNPQQQQIQIQQPHMTINVHQTTIHPSSIHVSTASTPSQNIAGNTNPIQITNQIQIQQITVQPSSGKSNGENKDYNCSIKQDAYGGQELKIQSGDSDEQVVKNKLDSPKNGVHIPHHLRQYGDPYLDRAGLMDYRYGIPPAAMLQPYGLAPPDKDITFLSNNKTTTITPILASNKNGHKPSDVIEVVDSDGENVLNGGKTNSRIRTQSNSSIDSNPLPPMKKRKLEILREGGLEVTPISKGGAFLPFASTDLNIPKPNVPYSHTGQMNNGKTVPSRSTDEVGLRVPKPPSVNKPPALVINHQTSNMFMRTNKIFDDPHEQIRRLKSHNSKPKTQQLAIPPTIPEKRANDLLDLTKDPFGPVNLAKRTSFEKPQSTPIPLSVMGNIGKQSSPLPLKKQPIKAHPEINLPPGTTATYHIPSTFAPPPSPQHTKPKQTVTTTTHSPSVNSTPTSLQSTYMQSIHNSQNHNIKKKPATLTVDQMINKSPSQSSSEKKLMPPPMSSSSYNLNHNSVPKDTVPHSAEMLASSMHRSNLVVPSYPPMPSGYQMPPFYPMGFPPASMMKGPPQSQYVGAPGMPPPNLSFYPMMESSMYLSALYGNPWMQSIPPELLQMYKNMPGYGVNQISKN